MPITGWSPAFISLAPTPGGGRKNTQRRWRSGEGEQASPAALLLIGPQVCVCVYSGRYGPADWTRFLLQHGPCSP